MTQASAKVVIEGGEAEGEALVLTAPISFWGGVDPKTGNIIDVRHPQFGMCIHERVLFVPATMGSSTASTVLLELVHCGKAPAVIVLHEPDAILLLGLIAAREMELPSIPAVTLPSHAHEQFHGTYVGLELDGTLNAKALPE